MPARPAGGARGDATATVVQAFSAVGSFDATYVSLIALFTVAERTDRRTSAAAAIAVGVAFSAVIAIRGGLPGALGGLVQTALTATVAWAAGVHRDGRGPGGPRGGGARGAREGAGRLAAVVNGVVLLGVAVYVRVEAWRRLADPPAMPRARRSRSPSSASPRTARRSCCLRGAQARCLAMRGAYLEVLGDLAGSAAVIVAALVVMVTGWRQADVVADGATSDILDDDALLQAHGLERP